jgi:hypothetical protein
LNLFRSEDDGGAPILDYELEVDGGTLTSSFVPTTYDYSTDGFIYTVDRVANSLTTSSLYRFRYRSKNAMGYSDYSDVVRFGLGPLPDTPAAPTRSSIGNSANSIGVQWVALTG